MMNAFRERLVEELQNIQDEILNDTISKNNLQEAQTDWEKTEVVEATAYVLSCQLIGGAWATMDEWGTGSLMDTSNPNLAAYRSSDMWNPHRKDTKIRTRAKGEYTNIFGEQQISRSTNPGIDLERSAEALRAKGRVPKFPLLVIPPSHALRTAIAWIKTGRLNEIVNGVIKDFPFTEFLEIDIRG